MASAFDELVGVMKRLRRPGGCPWDRKQTHESLKTYLIEEAYEVLEAIDTEEMASQPKRTSGAREISPSPLCEELGDLLFQILFHADIADEDGRFNIETVLTACAQKMKRRHPHIFVAAATPNEPLPLGVTTPAVSVGGVGAIDTATVSPISAEAVISQWEEIKRRERKERGDKASILDGVPKTLPALLSAHQVQSKAGHVGFDWKTPEAAFPKIDEEMQEVKEALSTGSQKELEAELGDLLFSIVNVARLLKINPEEALRKTVTRFIERFKKMELAAGDTGFSSLSLDDMNRLWEEAKQS